MHTIDVQWNIVDYKIIQKGWVWFFNTSFEVGFKRKYWLKFPFCLKQEKKHNFLLYLLRSVNHMCYLKKKKRLQIL